MQEFIKKIYKFFILTNLFNVYMDAKNGITKSLLIDFIAGFMFIVIYNLFMNFIEYRNKKVTKNNK